MAQDKTILAIFDFDGTLTTGHLWSGISRHHHQKKVKRLAVYWYLFSHMPYWLAAKMKLYSQEDNRAKWGEDLPVLFRGFTREEANKAFEWVADNYFMPLLRPDVMAVLNEHKKAGNKIVLLSGMFTDFLEIIGRRIGADFVVGTQMEMAGNLYTGKIVKPLCFGENKAAFLKATVKEKGLQVDYAGSSAYADSFYDLPVFRMVGKPVATYPDSELYLLAFREKWQVIC